MNRSYEGIRILLVHAHPDDETINNGATMALYADRGAQVTLVTCTRGEEGEVLVPGLSHLASTEQDLLGPHRETELALAMKALGISDYRFLGAPSRKFRDSGMMGTEANNRPDVFWQADLDTAAKILVEVIEEVKLNRAEFMHEINSPVEKNALENLFIMQNSEIGTYDHFQLNLPPVLNLDLYLKLEKRRKESRENTHSDSR